jgi:hypothetical protein
VILVKRLLNWDIKAGLVVGSPVNLSEILFFFFFLITGGNTRVASEFC